MKRHFLLFVTLFVVSLSSQYGSANENSHSGKCIDYSTMIGDHEKISISLDEVFAGTLEDSWGKNDFVVIVELWGSDTRCVNGRYEEIPSQGFLHLAQSQEIYVGTGETVKPGATIEIQGSDINAAIRQMHPETDEIDLVVRVTEVTTSWLLNNYNQSITGLERLYIKLEQIQPNQRRIIRAVDTRTYETKRVGRSYRYLEYGDGSWEKIPNHSTATVQVGGAPSTGAYFKFTIQKN